MLYYEWDRDWTHRRSPFAIIIMAIRIYSKNMSEKTAMEKDAINKGLLAYFLTDSPLLGWLVYRKNDPKNRLKQ